MKDFKGNELNIGDKVLYIEGSYFREGYITKMSEAKLHIKYQQNYTYTLSDGSKRRVEGLITKVKYKPHSLYKLG